MADKMYVGSKALMEKDGKILALKCETEETYYWILPGGRIEYGESVEDALERELEEEVSVEAEDRKLAGNHHFFTGPENEGDQVVLFVFETEWSGTVELGYVAEEDGIVEYRWFNPLELADEKIAEGLSELLRKRYGDHA